MQLAFGPVQRVHSLALESAVRAAALRGRRVPPRRSARPAVPPASRCVAMSVDDYTPTEAERPLQALPALPPPAAPRRGRWHRPKRPRMHKRRLLLVLAAFTALALVSALFGVLTSIAAYLPQLQNTVQFSHNVDSYMYDDMGRPIGPLAPASTPAIDNWNQISQNMVHAIVAVEDRGFWSESGISIRGVLRAALSDLTGGRLQGASTIPEQFIKNVRQEEDHRTIAEKLIEAGMAFQLSHHWSHEKILTEYLNTIYFGNGALGIEAAARVYFGWDHGYNASNPSQPRHGGCGDATTADPHTPACASMLTPAQAALLAAMVANPAAFDPALHPAAALARRNGVVLKDMYDQHYLTRAQYVQALNTPLPKPAQIQLPQQQPTAAPYFTSWVEPLIVHALEAEGLSPKAAQYEAYYGGLRIRLSVDLPLQQAAQATVNAVLPPGHGLPSASLVAIDNANGEVRAMVSGSGNYAKEPFNLATMGYRQPGSAFKLFTLSAALANGTITPNTLFDSRHITIHFVQRNGNAFAAPNGTGRFPIHNFANAYLGWIPMTVATAVSDNSVFAQLGTKVGTGLIAHYAHLMGIRSPVSINPSMILGGLKYGVSALDMAHAYSTAANDGVKVFNPILGDINAGAIGIDSISGCKPCRQHTITNAATMKTDRILTPKVDAELTQLLYGPVNDPAGTGTAAAIPGVNVAGKTGTTNNFVDAWFVGYTPQMTVAVWAGYPNDGKPMLNEFRGGPVEGGTYPAIIWHDYVVAAMQILQQEQQHSQITATVSVQSQPPASTTAVQPASAPAAAQPAAKPVTSARAGQRAAASATPGQNSAAAAAPAQTETLPQASTPPPAAASPAGSTNGGSGL